MQAFSSQSGSFFKEDKYSEAGYLSNRSDSSSHPADDVVSE